MQDSFSVLENCRLPVLAAIQGGCIGGGVDMVTACDIRYATEDAFLTVFEINVGITADVGTFPRLVKLIPEGIVRELAYTGRRMPAEEAKEVGLINRVFPDQDAMLQGVFDIAAEIASKPPPRPLRLQTHDQLLPRPHDSRRPRLHLHLERLVPPTLRDARSRDGQSAEALG